MTFRPTILPFQLQNRKDTYNGGGDWVNHRDGAFATLEDAKFVVAALCRDAPSGGPYRVHCDPDTVARALYEAEVAIRLAQKVSNGFSAALREREALEERGQANQRSEEEPDPDSDGVLGPLSR